MSILFYQFVVPLSPDARGSSLPSLDRALFSRQQGLTVEAYPLDPVQRLK